MPLDQVNLQDQQLHKHTINDQMPGQANSGD